MLFLTDWFGRGDGPKRLGHSGDESRITDEGLVERHKKNRGQMPSDIFLEKKRYVRDRPLARPAQRLADFTGVSSLWRANSPSRLFGPNAIRFISHLGIRADEAHRLAKIKARIAWVRSKKTRAWGDQPPGESVNAPLIEAGIDRDAVATFWESQNFNLELPPDGRYGNCVFCMMKGRVGLTTLAKECPSDATGPESIGWWAEMEARYGRDLIAEQRNRTQEHVTHFGFFGPSTGPVYETIRAEAIGNASRAETELEAEDLVDESYDDCHCTD